MTISKSKELFECKSSRSFYSNFCTFMCANHCFGRGKKTQSAIFQKSQKNVTNLFQVVKREKKVSELAKQVLVLSEIVDAIGTDTWRKKRVHIHKWQGTAKQAPVCVFKPKVGWNSPLKKTSSAFVFLVVFFLKRGFKKCVNTTSAFVFLVVFFLKRGFKNYPKVERKPPGCPS